MKPRDFKTHATHFNLLSPVSELSDYRILQVRGSHGNAYYAGKYSINCSLVVIVAARANCWVVAEPSTHTITLD